MSKSNKIELSEEEKKDNRLKSPLNPHIVWMRNTGNSNSEFWHVHPNMGANATPINTMRGGLGQTHTEMALAIRKISEMKIETSYTPAYRTNPLGTMSGSTNTTRYTATERMFS